MAEKNSLWKNIRNKAAQNRRTGATPKEPTDKMLRQERKIKAKQYAEGSLVGEDELPTYNYANKEGVIGGPRVTDKGTWLPTTPEGTLVVNMPEFEVISTGLGSKPNPYSPVTGEEYLSSGYNPVNLFLPPQVEKQQQPIDPKTGMPLPQSGKADYDYATEMMLALPAANAVKKGSALLKNAKQEIIYNAIDPVGYGVREKLGNIPQNLVRNTFKPNERIARVGKELSPLDLPGSELVKSRGKARLDSWRMGLGLDQKYNTFNKIGDNLYSTNTPNPIEGRLSHLYNDIQANKINKTLSGDEAKTALRELTRTHNSLTASKGPLNNVNAIREHLRKSGDLTFMPWEQSRIVEKARNPKFTHSVYDADPNGIMGQHRFDVTDLPDNNIHFQANDTWDLHPFSERGIINVGQKTAGEEGLKGIINNRLKNVEALKLLGGKPFNIQDNFIVNPNTMEVVKRFNNGGYTMKNNNQSWKQYLQYAKGGKYLTADGIAHKVYRGADGDIMVNHPKNDYGKSDTLNLTDKSDANTIAEGVASVKKWHRENPSYAQGGYTNPYNQYQDDPYLNYAGGGRYNFLRPLDNIDIGDTISNIGDTIGDVAGTVGGAVSDSDTSRTAKNVGAGAYGLAKGFADTTFGWIPGVTTVTSLGYKGLQNLGNSTEDEKREQDSIAGYLQAAGAVNSAVLTGGATTGMAIATGAEGLGQGIAKGSPDSEVARGVGTGLNVAGTIASSVYNASNASKTAKDAFKLSTAGSTGLGRFAAAAPRSEAAVRAANATTSTLDASGNVIGATVPEGTTRGVDSLGNAVSVKPTGVLAVPPPPTPSVSSLAPNLPAASTAASESLPSTSNYSRLEKIGNVISRVEDVTSSLSALPKAQEPPPMEPPITVPPPPPPPPQTNYDQFEVNTPEVNTGVETPNYDFGYDPTQATYSQGGNITNNSLNLRNTMRYKRFAKGGTFDQYGINMIPESAGLHHQNAYGGVPIGPDALAEGGEAKLQMADGGQYIVSGQVDGANTQSINGETMTQRLKKKLKPYMMGGLASNPKDKENLRRPFDSYSAEAINQAKQESIQETEAVRMQRGGAVQYAAHGGKLTKDIEKIVMEEYSAAYGGMLPNKYKGKVNMPNSYAKGGIHIKESKKGTFTAAATKRGKSVQEFAKQVLANKENYSPAMVKKANFARNASKWNHADGGYVHNQMTQPMYAEGGPIYGDPASEYVYAYGGMYGNPYARGGQIDYTNDMYSMYAGGGPLVGNVPQAFKGPAAQNRGGMYIYPDGGAIIPTNTGTAVPIQQPTTPAYQPSRVYDPGGNGRPGRWLDLNDPTQQKDALLQNRANQSGLNSYGALPNMYADGGMMSPEQQMMQEQQMQQQGGQDQMMQMVQQIAQAIMQGENPKQIMAELEGSGMPPEQVQQIMQAAMQIAAQQQQQQMMPQQGMMARGGYFNGKKQYFEGGDETFGPITELEAIANGYEPLFQDEIDYTETPNFNAPITMENLNNLKLPTYSTDNLQLPNNELGTYSSANTGDFEILNREDLPADFNLENLQSRKVGPLTVNDNNRIIQGSDNTASRLVPMDTSLSKRNLNIVNKDSSWAKEPWYSKLARFGQVIPGLAAMREGKRNEKRRLDPSLVTAQKVNYEPERIIDRKESRRAYSTYADKARNMGNQAYPNMKEALLNSNTALAGRIAESIMREGNLNTQLAQQADLTNVGTKNQFKQINEQMYKDARALVLAGLQDTTSKLASAAGEERKQYLQEWIAKNRLNTRNYSTANSGRDVYRGTDGNLYDAQTHEMVG